MIKYLIENYDFKKLNSNSITILLKAHKYQFKVRFTCKHEHNT